MTATTKQKRHLYKQTTTKPTNTNENHLTSYRKRFRFNPVVFSDFQPLGFFIDTERKSQ